MLYSKKYGNDYTFLSYETVVNVAVPGVIIWFSTWGEVVTPSNNSNLTNMEMITLFYYETVVNIAVPILTKNCQNDNIFLSY